MTIKRLTINAMKRDNFLRDTQYRIFDEKISIDRSFKSHICYKAFRFRMPFIKIGFLICFLIYPHFFDGPISFNYIKRELDGIC